MILNVLFTLFLMMTLSLAPAQDTLWINGNTLLSLQFPGSITTALIPGQDYEYIEDTSQAGLLVIGTRVAEPKVGKLMVRYEGKEGPRVYGAFLAYKEQVSQFAYNIESGSVLGGNDPGSVALVRGGNMGVSSPVNVPTPHPTTAISSPTPEALAPSLERFKGLKRRLYSIGVFRQNIEIGLENVAVNDQYIFFRFQVENLAPYRLQLDTLRISSVSKGRRWGNTAQNRLQFVPEFLEMPKEWVAGESKHLYFVSQIPVIEDQVYLNFSFYVKGYTYPLTFELPSHLLQNPQRL